MHNSNKEHESGMTEGIVASLQICPGHRQPMQARESILAIANLGFEGDLHAVAGTSRQVLIIDQETLDALGVPTGAVKENITTRGISMMSFQPGVRVKVGRAVLEVTKDCHPCSRMDEIRPGLQSALEGRRGVLARVLESGEIRQGDRIQVMAR